MLRQFSRNAPPYHLDEVRCTGTENLVSECTNSGVGEHDCLREEVAGVMCISESREYYTVWVYAGYIDRTSCVEGSVYLLGGDGVSRGRVQYCYNGTWHSVCADGWSTTGEEARTVCQSVAFSTTGFGIAFIVKNPNHYEFLPLSPICCGLWPRDKSHPPSQCPVYKWNQDTE